MTTCSAAVCEVIHLIDHCVIAGSGNLPRNSRLLLPRVRRRPLRVRLPHRPRHSLDLHQGRDLGAVPDLRGGHQVGRGQFHCQNNTCSRMSQHAGKRGTAATRVPVHSEAPGIGAMREATGAAAAVGETETAATIGRTATTAPLSAPNSRSDRSSNKTVGGRVSSGSSGRSRPP